MPGDFSDPIAATYFIRAYPDGSWDIMKLEGHYFVTVAESEKSPLGDLKMSIGHFAKSYADLLKSGTPMVDFWESFYLVPKSEAEKAGDLDNLAIEYAKQAAKRMVEEKKTRESIERGEYDE